MCQNTRLSQRTFYWNRQRFDERSSPIPSSKKWLEGNETVSLIRGLISSSSYHPAMRDAVRFTKRYTWERWLARSSCVPALLCWAKSFVFKASSAKMFLWVVWLLNSSICTQISNFSPIHSPRESFLTNLLERERLFKYFRISPLGLQNSIIFFSIKLHYIAFMCLPFLAKRFD